MLNVLYSLCSSERLLSHAWCSAGVCWMTLICHHPASISTGSLTNQEDDTTMATYWRIVASVILIKLVYGRGDSQCSCEDLTWRTQRRHNPFAIKQEDDQQGEEGHSGSEHHTVSVFFFIIPARFSHHIRTFFSTPHPKSQLPMATVLRWDENARRRCEVFSIVADFMFGPSQY